MSLKFAATLKSNLIAAFFVLMSSQPGKLALILAPFKIQIIFNSLVA
ncbi:hypothetical protein KR100_01250 [Synechococcus sp. KORDI-100]|nr:hypothetical protein KR100_01250 [Synechococcus sp. KORDI-100]